MSATIEISLPDPLLKALGDEPAELPRRTLEALVAQAYRAGRITHAQAGEILQLDRWQTDAFLKTAQAFRPSAAEEFAADLAALRRVEKK
ncbi:MAG: UPF0175 family protein [Verrucomicrobia bacterium]|nr:UPF0175 family protein [Verrucomicrobiota bacterium]